MFFSLNNKYQAPREGKPNLSCFYWNAQFFFAFLYDLFRLKDDLFGFIKHSHRTEHCHIVIRLQKSHPAHYGWPCAKNG